MNRYSCISDENGQPMMFESDTGDWYHRDDLIAAGVLVPVPDGEACSISDAPKGRLFLHENTLYMKHAGWIVAPDGKCVRIDRNTIVQPVSLAKLEDVEDLLRKSEINNDLG